MLVAQVMLTSHRSHRANIDFMKQAKPCRLRTLNISYFNEQIVETRTDFITVGALAFGAGSCRLVLIQ